MVGGQKDLLLQIPIASKGLISFLCAAFGMPIRFIRMFLCICPTSVDNKKQSFAAVLPPADSRLLNSAKSTSPSPFSSATAISRFQLFFPPSFCALSCR